MKRNNRTVALTGLFLCILVAACAGGVEGTKVDLTNYAPSFTADLSAYQGKHLCLMNFNNDAKNTTIWYYYSPDKKFTYGTNDNIHNYFWYSFDKALRSLGTVVSNEDRPDPNAPAMWLTLKSISDAAFTVEVKLQMQKAQTPYFTKMYTVSDEPVGQGERTAANLEQRAYAMTNRLIQTVLTDPEFSQALLTVPATTAAPRN